MSRSANRRPSAALIVAMIALVASFGGVAWALSKGSVKSKHIAKSAVKSKHIAKNAVTSKHVKDNALTGADIDEAQLGAVAKVDSVTTIPLVNTQPSAAENGDFAARAAATPIPLFSKGGLEVYAKCFKNITDPANPAIDAEVYIRSAADGAVFSSEDEDNSGNGFLSPSDLEDDRQILGVASLAGPDPGTLNVTDAGHSAFWAAAGTSFIEGSLFAGTKVGSPVAGDGLFGAGDRCLFGGTVSSG
jgi:hypothetical protein